MALEAPLVTRKLGFTSAYCQKLTPKFPLSVRRGSAAVSIRPYQNNGSEHFLITWNVLGKRHRESRSTLDAAKLRAEELATAISNGKIGATELSGADRDSYHHALHLLEPMGIPLHAAVEEFVAARNILGSGSLIDAAREHSMRNVTKLRSGTVPNWLKNALSKRNRTDSAGAISYEFYSHAARTLGYEAFAVSSSRPLPMRARTFAGVVQYSARTPLIAAISSARSFHAWLQIRSLTTSHSLSTGLSSGL